LHIAQIGTGRVGRPSAYTIMCANLADELTVCDVKPGLAAAFAEELKHVAASLKFDVDINYCEKDEEVAGADVILISAGEPRTPGVKMSRRDLAIQNGKIVKQISEATAVRNHGVKYVVISNPVDAMAMVCKKYSRADFVISTGTNLESLRFRSRLAEVFEVSVSKVEGWVGGEHGDAAMPLWSTVRVNGLSIEEFAASKGVKVPKEEIASYVKSVSKLIVDCIGGTEYGPAASFRDITRAIVKNRRDVLSVASPFQVEEIHEPVFVGIPTRLGSSIGTSIYDSLSAYEKAGIEDAAKAIHQTYLTTIEHL
jgi:malate dehydrogenase